MKSNGFTLIELLIVVAIIGILAAIAVPNFLNAQTRAKVARTMSDLRTLHDCVEARHIETNLWLIDGNDSDGTPQCTMNGLYFGKTAAQANIIMTGGQDTSRFNGQIYRPLTTPVSYMSSIPVDTFANGLFYSYEDYGCSNSNGGWAMMDAAGPDRTSGNWHRSMGPTPYASSNGVTSSGDIWYIWEYRSNGSGSDIFKEYYKAGWNGTP